MYLHTHVYSLFPIDETSSMVLDKDDAISWLFVTFLFISISKFPRISPLATSNAVHGKIQILNVIQ